LSNPLSAFDVDDVADESFIASVPKVLLVDACS
jgi:hypothetical protein